MSQDVINQTPADEWEILNKTMGRRPGPGTPLFEPHELGYACPVCGAANEVDITWSEFNNMIWCGKCKEDWPSCICKVYFEPRISNRRLTKWQRAKENKRVFLATIEDIKDPKPQRQIIRPRDGKKGLEEFL
jgi:hypothetical protein